VFRVGGGVDAKQRVVSKLGSWNNFKNLRGSLPAEYLMRSVGVEKVVVVRESEDYDVLEAIAGDGGIVI
jgi:hypothetical protein